MTTPTTAAGQALITATYGGKSRPQEDFEALRDAIRAIEAEARAAALDEAYRAVDSLTLAEHWDRVVWRRLQLDALAAIDALRERS